MSVDRQVQPVTPALPPGTLAERFAERDRRIRDLRARTDLARAAAAVAAVQRTDAEAAFDAALDEHETMPVLQARDRDVAIAGREDRAARAYADHLAGALAGAIADADADAERGDATRPPAAAPGPVRAGSGPARWPRPG